MPPNLKGCLNRLNNSNLACYVLVALSGALTPLAFAPFYLYWLMPILLGVLLWFAFHKPYPIRLAYIWGVSAYTAQFYWIYTALHTISGLANVYAIPLTLLLPLYLALYPALCFWVLEHLRVNQTLKLLVGFPALWLISEFVRERALTGFGWGALGYSQVPNSPIAGFIPIGGIQLATLAVAIVTALVVFILINKEIKHRLYACSCIALLLVAGGLLKTLSFTTPTGQKSTVGLAQGNIPQTLKWLPESMASTIATYYRQVVQTPVDILILPETAIPLFEQELPEGIMWQFSEAAERNNTALAMGISRYTHDNTGYLNAVIDLSDFNPEEPYKHPFYAKNHLVPFGEYIPLPKLTNWLYEQMNMPLSGFSQGGDAQAPLTLANQKVAFNICYEDSFGDDLIASAKESTLLANVSNMAWYGDSNAMDQHLQLSQARALELGRYMVRSTNTGMTAIISPDGKIQAQAKPNTEQVLIGEIEGRTGNTPFMKYGSYPVLLFCIAAFLCLFLGPCFSTKWTNNRKSRKKDIIPDHID